MNFFQVFTTGFDLLTDYRHETGHINLLPDPEPFIGNVSGSGIAGPRDPGSPGPVPDPETLPFQKCIEYIGKL